MASFTNSINLKKPSAEDFYDIEDFNQNFDKIDTAVASSVKKAESFTTGNIPKFDENGNVLDSGKKAADFMPSSATYSDIGAEKGGEAAKVLESLSQHKNSANTHINEEMKSRILNAYTKEEIVVSATQPPIVEGRIWIKVE